MNIINFPTDEHDQEVPTNKMPDMFDSTMVLRRKGMLR